MDCKVGKRESNHPKVGVPLNRGVELFQEKLNRTGTSLLARAVLKSGVKEGDVNFFVDERYIFFELLADIHNEQYEYLDEIEKRSTVGNSFK